MTPSLQQQLAVLEAQPLATLRQRFQATFGNPPAPRTSRRFLTLALAWHIQAQALGGLPAPVGRRLTQLKAARDRGGTSPPSPTLQPTPGTLLVRNWQGRRVQVRVLERGFEYEGRPYTNLSTIAREITGTRWSGPAFFGLNKPRSGRTA